MEHYNTKTFLSGVSLLSLTREKQSSMLMFSVFTTPFEDVGVEDQQNATLLASVLDNGEYRDGAESDDTVCHSVA